MSEPTLEETIHSLVFLVPKQPFFTWLAHALRSSGQSVEDFYFEEENMACLIPHVASLGSNESRSQYLDQLKKQLLIKTFGGIVTDWKQCPEVNSRTFDEFFDLKLRDKVWVAKQE